MPGLTRRMLMITLASSATGVRALAEPRPLAGADLLMYATVRLSYASAPGRSTHGTGFLHRFYDRGDGGTLGIVSNGHVFGASDTCTFQIAYRTPSGGPDLSRRATFVVTGLQARLLRHPDRSVDLAMLPLAPILREHGVAADQLFFVATDRDAIPSAPDMAALSAVEEVLTVGYPAMLYDTMHMLPTFHRGITATPPYIHFNGLNQFLIDVATWNGSSGSPVFIDAPGAGRGDSAFGHGRLRLLGVVWGVSQYDVVGRLQLTPASADSVQGQMGGPTVVTPVPTNLGACINATALLDFDALVAGPGCPSTAAYPARQSSDYRGTDTGF